MFDDLIIKKKITEEMKQKYGFVTGTIEEIENYFYNELGVIKINELHTRETIIKQSTIDYCREPGKNTIHNQLQSISNEIDKTGLVVYLKFEREPTIDGIVRIFLRAMMKTVKIVIKV